MATGIHELRINNNAHGETREQPGNRKKILCQLRACCAASSSSTISANQKEKKEMNSSREVRGRLKKRGSWLLPHRWRKRRPTVRVAVRRPCNAYPPMGVFTSRRGGEKLLYHFSLLFDKIYPIID
jgi:hypothetical protein